MAGDKLHVQDLTWQDRLLCGRAWTGQEIVGLMAAPACDRLCAKCRHQLHRAYAILAVRAEPKPGLQLSLWTE